MYVWPDQHCPYFCTSSYNSVALFGDMLWDVEKHNSGEAITKVKVQVTNKLYLQAFKSAMIIYPKSVTSYKPGDTGWGDELLHILQWSIPINKRNLKRSVGLQKRLSSRLTAIASKQMHIDISWRAKYCVVMRREKHPINRFKDIAFLERAVKRKEKRKTNENFTYQRRLANVLNQQIKRRLREVKMWFSTAKFEMVLISFFTDVFRTLEGIVFNEFWASLRTHCFEPKLLSTD